MDADITNDSVDVSEELPSEGDESERKGHKKKVLAFLSSLTASINIHRQPKRKKKKAATPQIDSPTVSRDPPEPTQSKEQRRAAKKARQKEQARANKDSGQDEIEKALQELSLKYVVSSPLHLRSLIRPQTAKHF